MLDTSIIPSSEATKKPRNKQVLKRMLGAYVFKE